MNLTNKSLFIAAAMAGLMAGAQIIAAPPAAKDPKGKCTENNSCKGHGSCDGTAKGEKHACAGQNACAKNVRDDMTQKDCKDINGKWKK